MVGDYLHEVSGTCLPVAGSLSRLIQAIHEGLPFGDLDALQAGLAIPLDRLASRLGISKATLHRRKVTGRLDSQESDRVVRFARLLGKAVEVLESEQNARHWLSSPQVGLGGAGAPGLRGDRDWRGEVEDLLGRIEYGVYS